MQWFHRNPIKATTKLDCDLGLIIKTIDARKLASDTTARRVRLLDLLKNPDSELNILLETFQLYIDSIYGYVYDYSEDGTRNDSKIRFTKHIRWSNTTDLKSAEPE
ncbi:hypothetical protein Ciccas_010695 [Cichlidogyrus casuarinus]|uniref:Uncharacterized protein n=1 Tax=Cichlidogyrus casuarinus TaxID=1844966 RepID=A0ABD2PU00_9PLAT